MSDSATLSRIARSLENVDRNTKDLARALTALNENVVAFVKMLKELEGDVNGSEGDSLQSRHETIL